MTKTDWQIRVFNALDKKKDLIEPADFRFYNIAHFPLLAKFTEEYSDECNECKKNIQLLDELIDSLPEALNSDITGRKAFEDSKTKIENHLKKVHHMRFPGFYTSLLSFIGVFVTFLISLLINVLLSQPIFNDITIIGLAVGLVGGLLIGRAIDKNIFTRNLQL